MGTQVHAADNYRRVVEIVQSGALGEISMCRAWVCGNMYPAGHGRSPDSEPPKELNYDMWLGPAPQRPYNKSRSHFVWRYYWDYGGGVLGDMGCHLLDVIYWALDLDAPVAVTAVGGKRGLDDDTDTPDSLEAGWEFAPPPGRKMPLSVLWTHSDLSEEGFFGRSMGVAFYGTNGTLVADYGSWQMLPQKGRLDGWKAPPPSIPSSPGHHREFLDSIKSRRPCSCAMERSHKLTSLVHLGNAALRSGRRLVWDSKNETFLGCPDAMNLLAREYRNPWIL
jgi:predicted dehydrogenase